MGIKTYYSGRCPTPGCNLHRTHSHIVSFDNNGVAVLERWVDPTTMTLMQREQLRWWKYKCPREGCGHWNKAYGRFCSRCGLLFAPPAPAPPAPRPSRWRRFFQRKPIRRTMIPYAP